MSDANLQYLTEKQVARILGISHRTLQRWRSIGGGPSFSKLGRVVRYEFAVVAEFAKTRERTSTSDYGAGEGGGH